MPRIVLVELIGAAIGHQHQLGAGVGEVGADRFLPDVLADRQAELDAAELDRLRHGPGREHALLVEGAVVGELALEGSGDHSAALGEQQRVIVEPAFVDDGADEHRRAGGVGRVDQPLGRLHGPSDKLGLQHQVLWRISGQLKFGAQQQIGAGGALAHLEHRRGIALKVADALVHLRERDGQAVGHPAAL